MTFNQIIAINRFRKEEDSKLEKIRRQRQLAGEVLAGRLYHGIELSETEERFVLACNRSMKPLDDQTFSALEKINKRRWS